MSHVHWPGRHVPFEHFGSVCTGVGGRAAVSAVEAAASRLDEDSKSTPPPVCMGMPMGTASASSPTAARMSARTCALVRLTVEPLDGGPQPRRTSESSAARATLCIVRSGDVESSSADDAAGIFAPQRRGAPAEGIVRYGGDGRRLRRQGR